VTKKDWKEINNRKSRRHAQVGLEIEEKIALFLQNAVDGQENQVFEGVLHHKQFSKADFQGKDITVYRKVNGSLEKRSFGVTTSLQRFHRTKKMHPGVVIFYTPVDFNPQKFLKKILELFD